MLCRTDKFIPYQVIFSKLNMLYYFNFSVFFLRLDKTGPSDVWTWGSSISETDKIAQAKITTTFKGALSVSSGCSCIYAIRQDYSVIGLGKWTFGSRTVPVSIRFEPECKIVSLSVSMGIGTHVLALTDEGRVFSWGDGKYGKLGHGNEKSLKVPKILNGTLCGILIKQISTGQDHSAALSSDGTVYIWGSNQFGQLGLGL